MNEQFIAGANELDYFGWSEAFKAVGDGIGSIGNVFSAKATAKGQEAVAKAQSAADVSKSYYDWLMAGTGSVGATNQALIAASAARQQSKDGAKQASSKKWIYIGVAAAAGITLLIVVLLFTGKKSA